MSTVTYFQFDYTFHPDGMEFRVGSVFDYDGRKLVVVKCENPEDRCAGCAGQSNRWLCSGFACKAEKRSDHTQIILRDYEAPEGCPKKGGLGGCSCDCFICEHCQLPFTDEEKATCRYPSAAEGKG